MAIILVIEDHEVALSLCKVMLGEKHKIIEARNSDLALDLLKECKPDLIIADLMVPNSTGSFPKSSEAVKLIDTLHTSDSQVKILVYSVLCYEPHIQKQAFDFGASACLLKMGNVEIFRQTVNSLLGLEQN